MAGKLDQDIQQIVQSPYPVSLKALYDAVRSEPEDVIHHWACRNPGQLKPLALSLVEGLETWPYASDLLRIFCSNADLREAVLSSSPVMLSKLLTLVTSSEDNFNRLSGLCVELLCSPLSAGIVLPAPAQTYLEQLFERTLSSPTLDHVKSLHAVLRGACANLLDLLPATSMVRFRDQLAMLLTATKRVDHRERNLYSTAVLSKFHLHLARTRVQEPAFSSSPGLSESVLPHDRDEISNHFAGDRVTKTLNLVVSHVLRACCVDPELRDSDAKDLVSVAREIIVAVDRHAITDWTSAAQQNRDIINRIAIKGYGATRSIAVQIEVVDFMCAFMDTKGVQDQALRIIEQCMSSTLSLDDLGLHSPEALSGAISTLAPRISPEVWTTALYSLCKRGTNSQIRLTSRMRSIMVLVKALRSIMPVCKALRICVLESLSAIAFEGQMRDLLYSPTPSDDQARQLHYALLSIFLSAGLCAEVDETSVPPQLVMQFISKQENLAITPMTEAAHLHRDALTLHLPASGATDVMAGSSRDWRGHLQATLDSQASRSRDSIIHLFGRTCRDFEDRCQNAEKPLREEQIKSGRLQQELDIVRTRNAELAEQLSSMHKQTHQLQADLASRSSDVHDISAELDMKIDQVDRQRDEIDQLKKDKKEQSAIATDHYEALALELQSLRAKHNEGMQRLQAEHDSSKTLLDEAKRSIEEHKDQASQANHEVEGLQEVERTLTKKIMALDDTLSAVQAEAMAKEKEHAVTLEKERVAYQRAEVEHARLLHEADENASRLTHDFESRLRQANASHDNFVAKYETSLENHRKLHSVLKRKYQQLSKECDKLHAELANAQDWRTKVMSVMDFGETAAQAPQMSTAMLSRKNSKADMCDRMAGEGESEPFQAEAGPETFDDYPSPSMKSAPSPKRSKPRKKFKIPTARTQNVEQQPSPVHGRGSRRALSDIALRNLQHANPPERRHSVRYSKSISKQAAQVPSSSKSLATISTWSDERIVNEELEQSQPGQENMDGQLNLSSEGFMNEDFDETTIEV